MDVFIAAECSHILQLLPLPSSAQKLISKKYMVSTANFTLHHLFLLLKLFQQTYTTVAESLFLIPMPTAYIELVLLG